MKKRERHIKNKATRTGYQFRKRTNTRETKTEENNGEKNNQIGLKMEEHATLVVQKDTK